MRIKDMNWMQVEAYLKRDDRAVLPVGSTEQHAQLSLMVDCILSERVSVDAAEPSGVPVFPAGQLRHHALFPGLSRHDLAAPGHLSSRSSRDILDSLADQGFRRIVIVNGHGGNSPAATLAQEWMTDHPGTQDQIPQLVQRAQDLGQGASRSIPWPPMPPGWRTSPGRGCRGWWRRASRSR